MDRIIGIFLVIGMVVIAACGDDGPTGPGRVGGLSVSQGYMEDAIAASWSAVGGASGYEVERALFGEAPFLAVTNTVETNCMDRDVRVGEDWHYRVRALGAGGPGPWSTVVAGYCSGLRVVTLVSNRFPDYGNYSRALSIALDGAGRPHLLFVADGGIRYGRPQGASWQYSTIPGSSNPDPHCSLALDDMGRPHAVWKVFTNSETIVRYAKLDTGTWTVADAVAGGVPGADLSLALDPAGLPHFAHMNDYPDSGYELHYAHLHGAAWQNVGVDTNAETGIRPTLAIGSAGTAHIVFHQDRSNALHHAVKDGGDWQISPIDTDDDPGEFNALVLDQAQRPHVAYSVRDTADLRYARHDGSAWTVETLPGVTCYSFPGLALDAGGQPVIAFYRDQADQYGVWIARKVSGTWQYAGLDSGLQCGRLLAMRLDGYGRAHLIYYDDTRLEIRYACWLE